MSAIAEPTAARRAMPRAGEGVVVAALVLAATALTLVSNAGLIATTLHGGFADPDDAMRLVEVRAWLAGQPWFDLTAHRLDPPLGASMHWSRLVDLPAAAFIRLFALGTNEAQAERLACIAVPTLWLALLYLGMARLAARLVGPAGILPAVVGTFLSGAVLVQFGPGRIGHHAPETVTLVFALGAAVAALDPRRARAAAVAGALVALSLAMSLETLPFQAAMIGMLVALWVWDGPSLAPVLRWLALGLLLALPPLFLLSVRPDRWLAPVCDAFGAAHLGAGLIGAAGLLGLAAMSARLHTRATRAAAAGSVAVLVLAYVAVCFPACLHSPFADVDPLVREMWLAHVTESLPLLAFLDLHPMLGLAVLSPLALGVAACLAAALASSGLAQRRFALVAALAALGLALAFWQTRVLTSTTPIALLGGVFAVTRLHARLGSRPTAVLAPGAIVVFSSTAWALALPPDPVSPAARAGAACLAPEAIAPLATLPKGTAVAPIESGAYLLEATRLDVFAAPYHRNNDGNRFAYDILLAPPTQALELLAARRVDYVITCPGTRAEARLSARAPDGLAARLARGHIPSFLSPIALPGTPYRVYAVSSRPK